MKRFGLVLMIPAMFLTGCGDETTESGSQGTSYNSPTSSTSRPNSNSNVSNMFVGAMRANDGSFCTEYRLTGSAQLERLSSVKDQARRQAAAQKATFQETECSTNDALGKCQKEMSGNGGKVHMSIYFFAPATDQVARASCTALAGSYQSLN